VRRLTDETGAVTDAYTYTAFGELLSHSGTDPQPYAFAGEPYDPNAGFQYHRARWMDPRAGRFLGMDPWRGNHFEPSSLHRYLYAHVNPTNNVDPSGRETLPQQLTALASKVTLFIANVGLAARAAFQQGGPVLGEFFQSLGRYAQARASDVLYFYQRVNPDLTVEEEVAAGAKVVDFLLRSRQVVWWLEAKYGLPWRAGEALTRMGNQLRAAIATGRGEVALWAMRAPTSAQQELLKKELGNDAHRVRLIHGIEGLWEFLKQVFG
jgi:RHS repeat-associated protein